jgi:hypothetical protein
MVLVKSDVIDRPQMSAAVAKSRSQQCETRHAGKRNCARRRAEYAQTLPGNHRAVLRPVKWPEIALQRAVRAVNTAASGCSRQVAGRHRRHPHSAARTPARSCCANCKTAAAAAAHHRYRRRAKAHRHTFRKTQCAYMPPVPGPVAAVPHRSRSRRSLSSRSASVAPPWRRPLMATPSPVSQIFRRSCAHPVITPSRSSRPTGPRPCHAPGV